MPTVKGEIDKLLPWYINQTLSEFEIAQIEQCKIGNPYFQCKINEEKSVSRWFDTEEVELQELLQDQENAFNTLKEKINLYSEGSTQPVSLPEVLMPELSNKTFWSRFPYAVAASVLLLAGFYFVVEPVSDFNQESYQVLTTPTQHQGTVVQLVFAASVSTDSIQQNFDNRSADVLSGPSNNGVYRIRIDEEADLNYWQQHENIRWAEIEVQ